MPRPLTDSHKKVTCCDKLQSPLSSIAMEFKDLCLYSFRVPFTRFVHQLQNGTYQ